MSERRRPEDLDIRGDGRDIDPERGELSGEGAQQRVKEPPKSGFTPDNIPASGATSATPSYYGQPVLKQPVWIWSVPLYFYVGGTAGAASLLGATAEVLGGERLRALGLEPGHVVHDLHGEATWWSARTYARGRGGEGGGRRGDAQRRQ